MNPYAVLGIVEGSSSAEVKKAYRRMAQKYHPDKNKTAGAADKFKLAKEAFDFISSGKSSTGAFTGTTTRPKPSPRKPAAKPAWEPPKYDSTYDYNKKYTGSKTYHGHSTAEDEADASSTFTGTKDIKGNCHCSFEDLFGSDGTISGTGVTIPVPYGAGAGVEYPLPIKGTDVHGNKYSCKVTFHPTDAKGFFYVTNVAGEWALGCTIKVTTAQSLIGKAVKIRNINPALPELEVPLSVNNTLVKVEHAGLPREGRPRGNLYVKFRIEDTVLEDEMYSTLVELRAEIDKVLKSYKYFR